MEKIKKNNIQNLKTEDLEKTDQQIGTELLDFVADRRRTNYRTVSKETEELLFKKAQAGDHKALKEIMEIFGWLIKKSAIIYHKYRPETSVEELIKKASFAIREAAKHYKKTEEYSFPSYAMWWILTAFGIEINKIGIPK